MFVRVLVKVLALIVAQVGELSSVVSRSIAVAVTRNANLEPTGNPYL